MRATLTPSQFKAQELEENEYTPDELEELLTPMEGDKDGAALIPAIFAPCPERCWRIGQGKKKDCGGGKAHRVKENVIAMTGVCADIDDVTPKRMGEILDFIKAKGVLHYVWETHSHKPAAADKGEAKGRYRILIPFQRALAIANATQWTKGAWPMLVKHFGLENVPGVKACSDPGRLYYLPRHPAGETRESIRLDGSLFDAHAIVGNLDELIAPVKIPAPIAVGEHEDPTRPIDFEALKHDLPFTRNTQMKEIATRLVKGELLTSLPSARHEGEISRHEAWWLATGRLSIIVEEWMDTDTLLQLLKPSHTAERDASPDDFTPWDEGHNSVVSMFLAQRATAGTRKAQYKIERDAKNEMAEKLIENVLRANGREDERSSAAIERLALSDAEIEARLEARHTRTGEAQYPGSPRNLTLLFAAAPEWLSAFKKNEVSGDYEFWPCVAEPKRKAAAFKDQDITTIRVKLSTHPTHPVNATYEEIVRAAEWVAAQNPYDPIRDYLEGVTWNGEKLLENVLMTHFGASPTAEDGTDLTEYLRAIGKRWFISAVARALNPGCQADSILQMEGGQGRFKTTALKALGGKWYLESTSDFEAKDTLVMLSSAWIVELAELKSFTRANAGAQKAFLSRTHDNIVRKYERYRSEIPRRCVFAGTTNDEHYLTDVTGNRRHWTFRAGQIDLKRIKRDRDQLWAEAVALYRAGEQWYLTPEEEAISVKEVEKRLSSDMIDDMIEEHFARASPEKRPRGVLPAYVAVMVLKDEKGQTPKHKIVDALKRLGFVHKAMRIDGQVVKRWATPTRLLVLPRTMGNDMIGTVVKEMPEAQA